MSQLQNFIRRTRLVFVRSSRLTKILILSAMVFSLVALAILRTAIGMGSNHLDSLRHQAAQLEQENAALKAQIEAMSAQLSDDVKIMALESWNLDVQAWKDGVTSVVKYSKDGLTYDVDFEAAEQIVSPKGKLKLNYKEIPMLDDPKYLIHFTISKFDGDSFKVLNYGKADTWSKLFSRPAEMDCGYYMLVSGSRMSGGNVFADVEFFTIEEGKTTSVDLVMRDIADQIRVIGSFDSEMKYGSFPGPSSGAEPVEKSVLETTGRGYFAVALVDYGTEPTNHALMDISAVKDELEAWGRPLLLVFATHDDYRKFRPEHFNLPSTVHFGIDVDGKMRNMIASEMKLDKGGRLPLIVLADTFNRVVFFSQGYSIGLGESLVKTSKAL